MKLKKLLITAPTIALIVGAGVSTTLGLTSCTHKILYIAHRGAPGGDNDITTKRFENNMEAFERGGLQSKFMGLETDVYRTSDGKFVVVHDDNPFLDQTTGGRIATTYVNDKSFNYCVNTPIVPSANYPSWVYGGSHYLTSFDDYLDICKTCNKYAIIEIKEPSHLANTYPPRGDKGYLLDESNSTNYLPSLWSAIEERNMQNQCYIISFQECYIRWFKTNYPELNKQHRLQQLCHWTPVPTASNCNTDYKTLIDNGFDISAGDPQSAWLLAGTYINITKEMIDYAHSKKRKFGVWTVDVKSIAKQYIKWKVDFITTDYYNFVDSLSDIPLAFTG